MSSLARRDARRIEYLGKGFLLILHGYIPPEPAPAPALGSNAEILDGTTVKELLDSAHDSMRRAGPVLLGGGCVEWRACQAIS
jgi:hypothetical protein